jgi:hypothetical protein
MGFSTEFATTSNALVTPKIPQLGMCMPWLGGIVLVGGFLALLIAAPLVRQSVKWSLKKARLWGSWMTHV